MDIMHGISFNITNFNLNQTLTELIQIKCYKLMVKLTD